MVAHAVAGDLRVGRSLRAVLRRAPVVLATAVFVTVAATLAALPAVLAAGGRWLLVAALAALPVAVGCVFAVAVPVAAVEPVGVAAALGRSSDLTRGRRLGVLVVYVPLALPAWLAARALGGGWPSAAVALPFAALLGVATAVLHDELRGPAATPG